MHHRVRGRRVSCTLLICGLAAITLGACGSSSSGDPATLLRETFSGAHAVNSGSLSFTLTVVPSGSRTLTTPIALSFGGPFQSRGKGKLPASNFNISISAQGKTGSIGIISTGTTGYVTLGGTSYQLPAATFQKLESSFSGIGGGSSGAPGLSKLGIDPLHWLIRPSVVGKESIGGTDTTHIRAGINVSALLEDLNTFLQKAASVGVSGARGISAATRNQIAAEVKNPSFDVWTGSADKTVRKLQVRLTLPVTGKLSSSLGGLSSADVGLSIQYAELNQPQTIQAPTTVRPFSEFAAQLRAFLASAQGTISGGSAISGAAGTTATSPSATAGAPSKVQRYSQCLQAVGQDVSKMQRCAALLNGQ
jgi:hypothetical protein